MDIFMETSGKLQLNFFTIKTEKAKDNVSLTRNDSDSLNLTRA